MATDINFIIQPMFDINIFGQYHRFPMADPIIGASLVGSTQQGVYQHYRCSFIKFYLFGLYIVKEKIGA